MARQDKESKKEQAAGTPAAGGGYANPAPEPAGYGRDARHAEEVKAPPSMASLRVLAYAAENGRKPNPRTDKSAPVEDARIKLEGQDVKFSDYQVTGPDGVTVWDNLVPGHYTLAASHDGYQEAKPVLLDFTQRTHTTAEICLVPLQAKLRFQAFHDVACSGDPRGCESLPDVPFEIYKGDRQIGKGITGGKWTEVDVQDFGRIVVKPASRVQVDGEWVQLPANRPLVFTAVPGGVHTVYAPYQPSLATLRVSALFVAEDGTEHHVPGVQIRLYAGAVPNGRPLRDRRTEEGNALVFSDLPSGPYTILAVAPEHFQGGVLEAVDPADSSVVVTLGPGGSDGHEFRFRHARGKLVGYIFAEKTQEPLPKVGLLLTPAGGGKSYRTASGAGGEFAFTGVPTGNYTLSFEQSKYTLDDGLEWVPAHGTPHRQHVSVLAGRTQYLKPCYLSQDEHLLTVRVFGQDGSPIPNAQFEVIDENDEQVGLFGTREDGSERVPLAHAGTYRVALSTYDNGEIRYAPETVYVNQPAEAILRLRGAGGPPPRPQFPAGPAEAVVDIPYPLLTEGASPSGWGSQSAPPNALDLGMTVEKTLRDVLGWKSKGFKGNAKGFREALTQSFALQEIQGHTEFTWTPRSYTVQAELGNVTGAQASIYNRAKVALDQSLPLLDGLYPLTPAADEQNMEAIRSIVRSGFTELVNELGIEGGPRVVRIDSLFEQLLGLRAGQAPPQTPEQVRGQLGVLARVFGLERNGINTIAEEQNFTNFLIVVDYVTSLYQSWSTQRAFFTRTAQDPFLGTQLVHVSRSLAVVAESVQEVYMAMDSVFVGHAERQVVELTYPGEPSLFVAELLSWVESAASQEGPELIQNGGKAGVVAFQPTLDRLARLVNGALVPPQNPADLPAGYRTARVQRALQELAEHLEETARLAGQIRLQNVA